MNWRSSLNKQRIMFQGQRKNTVAYSWLLWITWPGRKRSFTDTLYKRTMQLYSCAHIVYYSKIHTHMYTHSHTIQAWLAPSVSLSHVWVVLQGVYWCLGLGAPHWSRSAFSQFWSSPLSPPLLANEGPISLCGWVVVSPPLVIKSSVFDYVMGTEFSFQVMNVSTPHTMLSS